MKTTRYIILLAAAVLSMACSKEEPVKHGKGDAVVSFAKSSYTFKESAGIATIPVSITGTPKDYPLTFDIKVEAVTSDKKVDEMFLFTQTSDIKFNGAVMADSTYVPVNIEFKVIDDAEINEDRLFKISIVNVKGAKTGDIASAEVIVKDNDNNPYEKLWGDWIMTGVTTSGAAYSSPVMICGGFTSEEIEANADNRLACCGFAGYQWSDGTPCFYIGFDADNEALAFEFGYDMTIPGDVNWGLGGDQNLPQHAVAYKYDAAAKTYSTKGTIPGVWSKDFNTITFAENYGLAAVIYIGGAESNYLWSSCCNIVLTRK